MLCLLPGTPGKETKKIVALCVLFVAVLGGLWWFSWRSQTVPGANQLRPGRPADVEDAEQQLPPGAMRVETVPDETGIPAPSGKIADSEGMIEEDYLVDILKAAKRIPAAELRSRARKVQFSDFFHNPEDWRGKVMRVEGRICRLAPRKGETEP